LGYNIQTKTDLNLLKGVYRSIVTEEKPEVVKNLEEGTIFESRSKSAGIQART
jgi:hypothetical protein